MGRADGRAACSVRRHDARKPALFTDEVAVLAQYGISLTAYATLVFLLHSAANLGYLSLAGVLF